MPQKRKRKGTYVYQHCLHLSSNMLLPPFSLPFSHSPGRQKKHPGLTDLTAHSNTARKRLERKVLNKKTLKRVTNAMNSINSKRFTDKFGDNFNYALKD